MRRLLHMSSHRKETAANPVACNFYRKAILLHKLMLLSEPACFQMVTIPEKLVTKLGYWSKSEEMIDIFIIIWNTNIKAAFWLHFTVLLISCCQKVILFMLLNWYFFLKFSNISHLWESWLTQLKLKGNTKVFLMFPVNFQVSSQCTEEQIASLPEKGTRILYG